LVSSGYANVPIMSNFKAYGFKGVIAKPYSIEELSEAVQNVMVGNS
jgi:DNA-binding NarL/FixJ family response regulator